MNVKDRIMAVLHGEEPYEIPLAIYAILMPRGAAERELRNDGVALINWVPVYKVDVHDVKLIKATNWSPWAILDRFLPSGVKHDVEETYYTPVGSVSIKNKVGLNFVGGQWTFEPMIKNPSDYNVVKHLIENTEVIPDYDSFLEAERLMGSDGVVFACGPKSPLQEMIMLMGYRNFSVDFFTRREEFEDLYRVLFKKILEEYQTIADSPAELVWGGENLNGIVTNPKMFQKYNMPFYDRATSLLHKKSKLYATHFDGRLKCLRDLISKTDIDIIEALCPPPIGDLPIKEARRAWVDKHIWVGFPCSAPMIGQEEVERQTIEILKDIAPGDKAAIEICEDLPLSIVYETLRTMIRTIKRYGKYPISL